MALCAILLLNQKQKKAFVSPNNKDNNTELFSIRYLSKTKRKPVKNTEYRNMLVWSTCRNDLKTLLSVLTCHLFSCELNVPGLY